VSVRNLNLLLPATFLLVSAVWILTIIARNPAPFVNVSKRLSHQEQFQVRLAGGDALRVVADSPQPVTINFFLDSNGPTTYPAVYLTLLVAGATMNSVL